MAGGPVAGGPVPGRSRVGQPQPTFFDSPAAFRAWLTRHHAKSDELLVGFWKKATGKPSMTWAESVDEALCYGWIDGVRRRIDDESYSIRFTPRRPGSVWSARNVARVEALQEEGRMRPVGLAVWDARGPEWQAGYSFEGEAEQWTDEEARAFGDALGHFHDQPAGYRRQWVGWVHAAKRPETRQRRLMALVEASRQGIRVNPQRPFEHVADEAPE